MEQIPFLAGKKSLLRHLRDAESLTIAEAIRNLEEDKKYREEHPDSPGGEMSWEERKKKYDKFYEALAEIAKERFSQEDLVRIFRMASSG